MVKVYAVSLGCPKNRVDSEYVLGYLGPDVSPAQNPADADLVFVNTCGFIRPAVEESASTILELVQELEGVQPKPLLAVGGCLPGRYGIEDLQAEIPEVDIWFTNKTLEQGTGRISRRLRLEPGRFGDRYHSTEPSYAYLKIGDGCRHKCSFCTIPSIRGKPYSLTPEQIITEAHFLLDRGVKELILTAQDLTDYGRDIATGLAPLVTRLAELPDLERLRLMYLYPSGLNDEVLKTLADVGTPLQPYFDVPLQHAHPDILRAMGRPFSHNPEHVLERIRTFFPDAAVRTSLITGFPGETEAHFQALLDFVRGARFHHLGVFAYQAEDGTRAAEMEGQIPDDEKEARRDEIMRIQSEISEEILADYVGETMDVLIDSPHPEWPELHVGRAWFQAPEIDGIVYVSGSAAPGDMVSAEIVDATAYDLNALL